MLKLELKLKTGLIFLTDAYIDDWKFIFINSRKMMSLMYTYNYIVWTESQKLSLSY